jgi:predicted nucleic acid-binding Zn ribbon protein
MDSGKTIQEAPIQCSWCMISIERNFKPPLVKIGENFCSRSCFLAKRYEKIRNSTLFLLVFAIIFPLAVVVPYPGDKMLLLGDFTGFYVIFAIVFTILIYFTYRAQLARKTRPKNSRIDG